MARGRRNLTACMLFLNLLRAGALWGMDAPIHHVGSWTTREAAVAHVRLRSRLLREALLVHPHNIASDESTEFYLPPFSPRQERTRGKRRATDCSTSSSWRVMAFVTCPFPISSERQPLRSSSSTTIPPHRPRAEDHRHRSPLGIGWETHRRRTGAMSAMGDEALAASGAAAAPAVAVDIPSPSLGCADEDSARLPQQESAARTRPEIPKWKHKAVIIPGFATDARAFEQLCHRLQRRGIASVVVPIRWYHWLPTLGGRSVRPILDRIHETVIRCVGAKEGRDMPYAFNEPGLQSEVAPYTVQDFCSEMADPTLGAHHTGPLDLPDAPDAPLEDDRVILIAHSAGGWMSRIYLSEANYDGRRYNGSSLVSGLVTLGTPHVRLEDAEGQPRQLPFSRNFKFVQDFCTGEEGGSWEKRTPTACIGGTALQGQSACGGLLKDLVFQSYELCCGDGTVVGDGITPLESAFDMAGAKRFVKLEGVYHTAGLGGPWYGSDNIIDSWLVPSLDAFFGRCTPDEDAPGVAEVPTQRPTQAATPEVRSDPDTGQTGVA